MEFRPDPRACRYCLFHERLADCGGNPHPLLAHADAWAALGGQYHDPCRNRGRTRGSGCQSRADAALKLVRRAFDVGLPGTSSGLRGGTTAGLSGFALGIFAILGSLLLAQGIEAAMPRWPRVRYIEKADP